MWDESIAPKKPVYFQPIDIDANADPVTRLRAELEKYVGAIISKEILDDIMDHDDMYPRIITYMSTVKTQDVVKLSKDIDKVRELFEVYYTEKREYLKTSDSVKDLRERNLKIKAKNDVIKQKHDAAIARYDAICKAVQAYFIEWHALRVRGYVAGDSAYFTYKNTI